MRKSMINLVIVLLISSIMVGCGTSGAESVVSPVASNEVATYAYQGDPAPSMDPSIAYTNGNIVLSNIYETLLTYESRGNNLDYALAKDYSVSEDGMSWTFELRRGVTFHDGTPFTAEAVKYSVDRTKEIGMGAAYIWDSVSEVVVVSDYEVRFDLLYPTPLDRIVSSAYGAFIMSPSIEDAGGSEWLEKGNEMGTGPYVLESFNKGSEAILSQYGDYWKGWDGEHFNKVAIKNVSEASARKEMIENGEADIATQISFEDIEQLESTDHVKVKTATSFENTFIFMNTNNEILSDKIVRQALSYAFPYGEVIDVIMDGYAEQALGVLPSGYLGHGNKLAQYQYDLDMAKELLEEAGQLNGFELVYTYNSESEVDKAIAEIYARELSNLNITLILKGMTADEQLELAKDPDLSKRQDLFAGDWKSDYSNPDHWLVNLFTTEENPVYNMSYYSNPKVDMMIAMATEKSGTNIEKAGQMYSVVQHLIIDDAPTINVMDKKTIWVLNNTFEGFKSNPNYPSVVFFYDTFRVK
jgi:peptide/nickel transport system substrate-binding protein